MDEIETIPADLLRDPRHLVPECRDCCHRTEEGLCGLERHPTVEWALPGGCRDYSPIDLEGGGDADPEAFNEY